MTVKAVKGPGADALKGLIKSVKGRQAKVGWVKDYTHEDGTPVAYIASIHEFGWGPIPARPFFRPAIEDNAEAWRRIARAASKKATTDGDGLQILELVAARAAGDVAKAIKRVQEPALKEKTVSARLSKRNKGRKKAIKRASDALRKPLVDTGIMLSSLTWGVE